MATWSFGAVACDRDHTSARPPSAPHIASDRDSGAPANRDGAVAMSTPPAATPPPLDVFAPPADAERDPSGLARKILTRGTGTTHPLLKGSYVELRYAGWERNGRQFEGSASNGEPGRYDPSELTEGLQHELVLMVEGERRRLWVPAAMAYGKRLNFANAPKGDMTFEVELVRIIALPPAPTDLAGPPKDTTKETKHTKDAKAPTKSTKSGLTYQVLTKGTGKRHPLEENRAQVIYSAWTPDGHMFQTSLINGDTTRVRVKLLPAGWREAMQLMVEGDKWRLWLPGKLAFGDLPPGETPLPFGPPPGPVIFDVELVKILDE